MCVRKMLLLLVLLMSARVIGEDTIAPSAGPTPAPTANCTFTDDHPLIRCTACADWCAQDAPPCACETHTCTPHTTVYEESVSLLTGDRMIAVCSVRHNGTVETAICVCILYTHTIDYVDVAEGICESPAINPTCTSNCSVGANCTDYTPRGLIAEERDLNAPTPSPTTGPLCTNAEQCRDGNQCTADVCDTGACANPFVAPGTACDDGNACTTDDTCRGGPECTGTPKDCAVLNDVCNVGACSSVTGDCIKVPRQGFVECSDGLFCTGKDYCVDGQCAAHSGNPCEMCALEQTCDEHSHTCVLPITTASPVASPTTASNQCHSVEYPSRCCPGYTGRNCDMRDVCYGKECLNGGHCNSSGRCICQDGFKGPACDLRDCGVNGWFNPLRNACTCRRGWAGAKCDECAAPTDEKTFICFPMHTGGGYLLTHVHTGLVASLLNGNLGTQGAGHPAIRPTSRGVGGHAYDCACQPIYEDGAVAVRGVTDDDAILYDAVITNCLAMPAPPLTVDESEELNALWDDCLWVATTGASSTTYFTLFIVFACTTAVLGITTIVFIVMYCQAAALASYRTLAADTRITHSRDSLDMEPLAANDLHEPGTFLSAQWQDEHRRRKIQ